MHFDDGFLAGDVLCGERSLWWVYAFMWWILLSSHTYTCTWSDEISFLQDNIIDEVYTGIYMVGGGSRAVQENITITDNRKNIPDTQ